MKFYTLLSSMLIFALFMQGCSNHQASQIKTQATSEVTLKADLYDLQVSFKGEGASSDDALTDLTNRLAEFMTWQASSGLEVASQNQSVRPEYHYPKQAKRELTGYVAEQSFKVSAMSLEVFTETMPILAKFSPENIHQGEVSVSDVRRQQALLQAYEQAFKGNEQKRDTLMALSHLCHAKVLDIQEQSHSHGSSGMMRMRAESAPVANEHTVSVTLNITWAADPC